jgi:nucleoside-diphosphate-sugar epimerase
MTPFLRCSLPPSSLALPRSNSDEAHRVGRITGGADQYGTTKAEGDRIVLEAIVAGFPATILRPGAILGVHPSLGGRLSVNFSKGR